VPDKLIYRQTATQSSGTNLHASSYILTRFSERNRGRRHPLACGQLIGEESTPRLDMTRGGIESVAEEAHGRND
jgi:hypothetical protein